MYFYAAPYPTLVGAVFATAAMVLTFVLAQRSGARFPALPPKQDIGEAPACGATERRA
jgi:hypothetical protein